jgi:predicted DNA-binding protein
MKESIPEGENPHAKHGDRDIREFPERTEIVIPVEMAEEISRISKRLGKSEEEFITDAVERLIREMEILTER